MADTSVVLDINAQKAALLRRDLGQQNITDVVPVSKFSGSATVDDPAFLESQAPRLAPHNQLFAGEKPDFPIKPKKTIAIVKEQFRNLVQSAQNVSIPQNKQLPWEFDTAGKWYSTEHDILRAKIDTLRTLLGLNLCVKAFDWQPYDNQDKAEWSNSYLNKDLNYFNLFSGMSKNTLTPDGRPSDAFNGAGLMTMQHLIQLELELKIKEDEKCFRDNLRMWILGKAPATSYKNCFWIKEGIKSRLAHISSGSSQSDKNIREVIQNGKISLSKLKKLTNQERSIFYAWMEETEKMVRNNPDITHGFINDDELMKSRVETFLKRLSKKIPTTQEEAYLWFKYIVLKKPIHLDYLCNEKMAPEPAATASSPVTIKDEELLSETLGSKSPGKKTSPSDKPAPKLPPSEKWLEKTGKSTPSAGGVKPKKSDAGVGTDDIEDTEALEDISDLEDSTPTKKNNAPTVDDDDDVMDVDDVGVSTLFESDEEEEESDDENLTDAPTITVTAPAQLDLFGETYDNLFNGPYQQGAEKNLTSEQLIELKKGFLDGYAKLNAQYPKPDDDDDNYDAAFFDYQNVVSMADDVDKHVDYIDQLLKEHGRKWLEDQGPKTLDELETMLADIQKKVSGTSQLDQRDLWLAIMEVIKEKMAEAETLKKTVKSVKKAKKLKKSTGVSFADQDTQTDNDYDTQLTDAQKQVQVLAAEVTNLKDALKGETDTSSKAYQDFEQKKQEFAQAYKEFKQLKDENEKLKSAKQQEKLQYEQQLQQKDAALQMVQQGKQQIEALNAQLTSQVATAQTSMKALGDELSKFKADLQSTNNQSASATQQLQQKELEYQNAIKAHDQLKQELEKFKDANQKAIDLEAEVQKLKTTIKDETDKSSKAVQNLDKKKLELDQANQALKQLQQDYDNFKLANIQSEGALKQQLLQKDASYQTMYNQNNLEVQQLKFTVGKLETDYARAQEELKLKIQEINNGKMSADDKTARVNQLDKELAVLKATYDSDKKLLDQTTKNYQDSTKLIQELQQKYKDLEELKKTEGAQKEAEITNKVAEIKSLQTLQKSIQDQIQQEKDAKEQQIKLYQELEKQYNALQQSGNKTTQDQIDKYNQLSKQYTDFTTQSKKDLTNTQTLLEETKKNYENEKTQREVLAKQKKALEDEKEKLVQEKATLDASFKDMQEQVREIKKLKEEGELKNKEKIEKKTAKLKQKSEEHTKLKAEYDTSKEALEDKTNLYNKLKSQHDNLQQTYDSETAKLKTQLETMKKQYDELQTLSEKTLKEQTKQWSKKLEDKEKENLTLSKTVKKHQSLYDSDQAEKSKLEKGKEDAVKVSEELQKTVQNLSDENAKLKAKIEKLKLKKQTAPVIDTPKQPPPKPDADEPVKVPFRRSKPAPNAMTDEDHPKVFLKGRRTLKPENAEPGGVKRRAEKEATLVDIGIKPYKTAKDLTEDDLEDLYEEISKARKKKVDENPTTKYSQKQRLKDDSSIRLANKYTLPPALPSVYGDLSDRPDTRKKVFENITKDYFDQKIDPVDPEKFKEPVKKLTAAEYVSRDLATQIADYFNKKPTEEDYKRDRPTLQAEIDNAIQVLETTPGVPADLQATDQLDRLKKAALFIKERDQYLFDKLASELKLATTSNPNPINFKKFDRLPEEKKYKYATGLKKKVTKEDRASIAELQRQLPVIIK